MSELARLLSLLFKLMHRVAPWEWFGVVGLAWWGYVKWRHAGPEVAWIWWGVAIGIALLSVVAKSCNYVIFKREEWATSSRGQADTLEPHLGVGVGWFYVFAEPMRVPLPYALYNMLVQVRWMAKATLPRLAVLLPADLDPTLTHPLGRAEGYSEWYPGTEVATGRLFVAGQEYPALRLRFLGRMLILGAEEEAQVDAIVAALQG